ncbi:MAG: hypothetical protein JRI89_12290 [Deltaproteobacteria bacterium]|nr:hypothetical protein [Deltaproteobacteria bacterium]
MDKAGGFLAEVSRILGMSRSTVTQRVKKSKRLQKSSRRSSSFIWTWPNLSEKVGRG